MLTAEELLAGSQVTHVVVIPPELLHPGEDDSAPGAGSGSTVRLRPLTISDLQIIARAAKESDSLVATLMVQQALLDPKMSVPQVAAMHAGLVQFLLEQVNRISGIALPPGDLAGAVEAPLARATYILAREFGWTPQEIGDLTLGQVLLHLQMLQQQRALA